VSLGVIKGGEDIARRTIAPILVVRPLKLIAVAGRPAGIRVDDAVAEGAEELELMPHAEFARTPHR
jgi:hypothetical protein